MTIRKRIWASSEEAKSRDVGENMRDLAQALGEMPRIRALTISNQFYTEQGFNFTTPTRPLGIVNVYSETVSGTVTTSPLSGMVFDKGVCNVRLSTLTPGVRYSTVRLLVIG